MGTVKEKAFNNTGIERIQKENVYQLIHLTEVCY